MKVSGRKRWATCTPIAAISPRPKHAAHLARNTHALPAATGASAAPPPLPCTPAAMHLPVCPCTLLPFPSTMRTGGTVHAAHLAPLCPAMPARHRPNHAGHHFCPPFLPTTTAPCSSQLQRLMQRDGLDEAAAVARVAAQMPLEAKRRLMAPRPGEGEGESEGRGGGHVLLNDGDPGELVPQVLGGLRGGVAWGVAGVGRDGWQGGGAWNGVAAYGCWRLCSTVGVRVYARRGWGWGRGARGARGGGGQGVAAPTPVLWGSSRLPPSAPHPRTLRHAQPPPHPPTRPAGGAARHTCTRRRWTASCCGCARAPRRGASSPRRWLPCCCWGWR